MGVMIAPVEGSGSMPAWMALVANFKIGRLEDCKISKLFRIPHSEFRIPHCISAYRLPNTLLPFHNPHCWLFRVDRQYNNQLSRFSYCASKNSAVEFASPE